MGRAAPRGRPQHSSPLPTLIYTHSHKVPPIYLWSPVVPVSIVHVAYFHSRILHTSSCPCHQYHRYVVDVHCTASSHLLLSRRSDRRCFALYSFLAATTAFLTSRSLAYPFFSFFSLVCTAVGPVLFSFVSLRFVVLSFIRVHRDAVWSGVASRRRWSCRWSSSCGVTHVVFVEFLPLDVLVGRMDNVVPHGTRPLNQHL